MEGVGGGGSGFHYLLLDGQGKRVTYLQEREESDYRN
jgi:hypothetical protein